GDQTLFAGCYLHYFSKTLTTYSSQNFAFVLPYLAIFFVLVFLLGRFFCGWMCPLGFIEEGMIFVRSKLGIKHIAYSDSTNKTMSRFRYGFLAFIFIISLAIAIPALGLMAFQKELYIIGCQICPARILLPIFAGGSPVLYSTTSPIVTFMSIIGIMFLLVYISGFVFRRPWCRICPSGALLSIFNSVSILTKEHDLKKCTKCGRCARVCQMDNKLVYLEKEKTNVSTANCTKCMRCVEYCPEKDCLKIKFLGKTIYSSGGKMKKWKRV
ncbi:4Fe-4S binding protein, partial [bacterium]|nr:4Fe-4S binding protein [bacterium]